MEDLGKEPHFGRSEGIHHRDLQIEVEDASLVWTSHRAPDRGLPVIVAAVQRFGLYSLRGVLSQTLEVVAQPLVPQCAGLSGEKLRHLEDAFAAEGTVDEGGELGEPIRYVDVRLEQRPPPPSEVHPLRL